MQDKLQTLGKTYFFYCIQFICTSKSPLYKLSQLLKSTCFSGHSTSIIHHVLLILLTCMQILYTQNQNYLMLISGASLSQGRSRVIASFVGQILSSSTTSKVNNCCGIQFGWENTCFYTVSWCCLWYCLFLNPQRLVAM